MIDPAIETVFPASFDVQGARTDVETGDDDLFVLDAYSVLEGLETNVMEALR